jgi:Ferredoxin subunits of nitrite reductase and ring-hydroxylating dioxygenases
MREFRDVFGIRDLPEGSMKKSYIDGQEIFLARVGDRYYAADNRCPHMGGDLSQGDPGRNRRDLPPPSFPV